MKENDFSDLLRRHGDCLFDEKKFRAIVSDLFPTEMQMNSILVNLFHLGLPRSIEENETIDNSIFFKYKKTVIKTYGIDQKLADEAVRLWIICYGEQVLGRKIKLSGAVPNVSDVVESEGSSENGKKEKGFSSCPFKVSIPKIGMYQGIVQISFKVMAKPRISVDVSLNEIYISDKLGRKYNKYFMGECKTKGKTFHDYIETIEIQDTQFLLNGSSIVLYFLAGDGKAYEVSYSNTREAGVSLEYVMGRRLSEKEIARLEESINESTDEEEEEWRNSDQDEDDDDNADRVRIPRIEEYKKAVLREKYFLQNEGGRKYKVTNGSHINSKNGLSTYSFEMEAELNLSDDAPITLTVGAIEATGSVLVCEGFQIIIVVDRDFGKHIGQAFIGVEPWKLLEALVNKLDGLNLNNRLALKLIEDGPGLATTGSASSIPRGQDIALNAVDSNEITVIWGPPGTGKTYTMSQIAIDAVKKGKSVLIVSHSNISVDGVVKQTVKGIRTAGLDDILKKGKVLRYGYVRDEDLYKEPYAVAYNYALVKRPDLKEQIDGLRAEKEELRQTGEYLSSKRDKIEKDLKKLRTEVREEERKYVDKALLVATTISKVTIDSLFDERNYDIVMFDEVSMAYVPQIVCAAMYAREKLVLVGDFRQLGPIVQSEAKDVLGVDIFSYLGIASGKTVCNHPWLVMLNVQRRMYPQISAFPNKYVYSNLLEDHDCVIPNNIETVQKDPFPDCPVNLINMAGTYCAAMKNSDNSRFNIIEAVISFLTALAAEQNKVESIGIITPYAAQTRLIRAMIQDHKVNDFTGVSCATVHQFQGSERDLIIFDAVESYPSSKVGFLMGKVMDSVVRLINVGVTRARGKLIVVANAKFWEMKFEGTQHIFYGLIKYLTKNGNVISNKEKALSNYLKKLPKTKNICYFSSVSGAISEFKKDISRAKEKIVISIPDGELDPETQGSILNILTEAIDEGIRVLCKTNGYAELPDEWKKLAWASDNAILPMIIIDDKVAWYGLPVSRGKFVDGHSSFLTICQTIFRIRGEHTIEMIKAFSDYEYREIDSERRPLLEKTGNAVLGRGDSSEKGTKGEKGASAAGMDAFIREVQKCPKCKSPMTLTRGKSGKCYLKCSSSSCRETSFLTPDIANWYINREHVKCPIHHCGIRAGLNKFGIYIYCDQRHYMKPDEI